MKDYIVNMTMPVYLTIRVEAETPEEAIDEAYELAYIENYVGNGGTDKIVGTRSPNVSLEAGDEVLEGDIHFEVKVEVNDL